MREVGRGQPPARARLSGSLIASLPSRARDYFVTDEEQRKLKLKVTPAGKKSFVLRYRAKDGTEKKLKLGDYPDINTQVARKLAADALLKIATGLDPTLDGRVQPGSPTLADIASRFLAAHAALHLRATTIRGYKSLLASPAFAGLARKPLTAVTKQDILELQAATKATRYQSNRLVGLVRRLFNYAIDLGEVSKGANPTDGVRLLKEVPKERLLSRDETIQIGYQIDRLRKERPESESALDAIVFLLLTGCRKGEALNLEWNDVDFERSTVFFRKTKTDPRKQWMTTELKDFLKSRRSYRASPFVFPGRSLQKPLDDIRKPWDHIRASLGLEEVRLHDIRHTVLSDIAAESDLQTAASVGGHKSIRSTIRYVHGRSSEANRALSTAAARTNQLLNSHNGVQHQEARRGDDLRTQANPANSDPEPRT